MKHTERKCNMLRTALVDLVKANLLRKLKSLPEEIEKEEWAGYHINRYNDIVEFIIFIDFKRIEMTFSDLGTIYVKLSEDGCKPVVIRLTKSFWTDKEEARTVNEIMNDIDTLFDVFYDEHFGQYLRVMNKISEKRFYSLEYHEWLDGHKYYLERSEGKNGE